MKNYKYIFPILLMGAPAVANKIDESQDKKIQELEAELKTLRRKSIQFDQTLRETTSSFHSKFDSMKTEAKKVEVSEEMLAELEKAIENSEAQVEAISAAIEKGASSAVIQEELKKEKEKLASLEKKKEVLEQALAESKKDSGAIAGLSFAADMIFAYGYSSEEADSLALTEVNLYSSYELSELSKIDVALLYDGSALNLDVAKLSLGSDEGLLSLHAGQDVLPLALFETHLVSDPFSIQLAETSQQYLNLILRYGSFSWQAFTYVSPTINVSGIEGAGLSMTYDFEKKKYKTSAVLSYLLNAGDLAGVNSGSDDFDVSKKVPFLAFSMRSEFSNWGLLLSYMSTLSDFAAGEVAFKGAGARPSILEGEVFYNFEMAKKASSLAAAYQFSSEAVALSLPKSKALLALHWEAFPKVTLSTEVAYSWNYESSEGGDGKNCLLPLCSCRQLFNSKESIKHSIFSKLVKGLRGSLACQKSLSLA